MKISTDSHFDSILFDMDGTLWDAVDSYCAVWNATIGDCCPGVTPVTYDRLVKLMGRPLDVIFNQMIGSGADYDCFMERLHVNEARIMPVMGGKLFMVSNCTALGLPVFLRFTRLEPFFTDAISFGDTGKEKDFNIRFLVDKYGLKQPLYVGDTAGDGHSAHAAGVKFAWAAYGFGHDVEGYDMKLDDISGLLALCPLSDK